MPAQPAVGRFTTRKQLEKFVVSSFSRKRGALTKAEIARDAQVSISVVRSILSRSVVSSAD